MKNILLIILTTLSLHVSAASNIDSRNSKAACDSTCASGAAPTGPSGARFRTLSCEKGFTGQKSQTSRMLANGTWSEWTDTSPESACTCANTYESQNISCKDTQEGSKTQTRTWTCSSPTAGSWSNWATVKDNCTDVCTQYPNSSYANCPYVNKTTSIESVGHIDSRNNGGGITLTKTLATYRVNNNNTITTTIARFEARNFTCEKIEWVQTSSNTGTASLQPTGGYDSAFYPSYTFFNSSPYAYLRADGIHHSERYASLVSPWGSQYTQVETGNYPPTQCGGGGGI